MSGFIFFIFWLLVSFPYVGGVNGIDVQPNFILIAPIILILLGKKFRFSLFSINVYLYSMLMLLSHMFLTSNTFDVSYLITYVVTFTTIFFAYNICNSGFLIHNHWVYISVFIYLLVGTVQLFDPDFLSRLVSRSAEQIDMLVESGRGVRSLTGEPSHFAKLLIFFNILIVYNILFSAKKDTRKILYFKSFSISVTLLLLSLLLAGSAYMLAIHMLVIALLLFAYSYVIFMLYIACAMVFIIMIPTLGLLDETRLAYIIDTSFNSPELLLEQGAFSRLTNIILSINSSLEYGLLGAGSQNSLGTTTIFIWPFGEYTYVISNRYFGGVIELFLKFGLLSIPIIATYIYLVAKLLIIDKDIRLRIFFAISILILTVQDGTLVNPLPWLIFFYILKNINTKKDSRLNTVNR